MNRHVLVTIGDDLNSLYGVRFAGSFFHNKAATRLTLLYVAPRFDTMDRRETLKQVKMDKELAKLYAAKGQAAMDAAVDILVRSGFAKGHLTRKLMARRFGTVKDIVHEGRAGNYDAVVLGRRGYVLFEKLFTTSISREILEAEIDFPVWICRRPEEGRRHVLLCVDSTDPSLRVADHVGFMLEKESEHMVTVFHVDTGKGDDPHAILDEARQRLIENHVAEGRIHTKIASGSNVVKVIIEEVKRGRYAVVAVGRGGPGDELGLTRWLTGSRSMELLETLEKAVLWVSK